jgi:hypothetical protein
MVISGVCGLVHLRCGMPKITALAAQAAHFLVFEEVYDVHQAAMGKTLDISL